jgi:hypothetical protein
MFIHLLLSNIRCLVAVLRLWMPAGENKVAVIVFSVVFRFSGSNISLDLVCAGKLCPGEEDGRYYTTMYIIVSFGQVHSSLLCLNG